TVPRRPIHAQTLARFHAPTASPPARVFSRTTMSRESHRCFPLTNTELPLSSFWGCLACHCSIKASSPEPVSGPACIYGDFLLKLVNQKLLPFINCSLRHCQKQPSAEAAANCSGLCQPGRG